MKNNLLIIIMNMLILLSICPFIETYAFSIDNKIYSLDEIHIRDPFILADKKSGKYYLYRSCSNLKSDKDKDIGGVEVFESDDLKKWIGPKLVLKLNDDNWSDARIWAPEVHCYNGMYYIFATVNSDISWKRKKVNWPDYNLRCVQIFYSKSPKGPFKAFSNIPHTPIDEMALDGTLWVEDGKPYMIYCQEWVQVVDGKINIVELKKDLSEINSVPVSLFCASAAKWSTGNVTDDERNYVTDGCFLYMTKLKKLLMIWSSFKDDKYAIGIAESITGSVKGPWRQQENVLFEGNGGHGMIFKGFNGKLFMVFHCPNSPSPKERAVIVELEDLGYTLAIKRFITSM